MADVPDVVLAALAAAVARAGAGVAEALAGLDFDDYRDKRGKGLTAVERFTGRGITAEDLDRIEAADVGYRIVFSP